MKLHKARYICAECGHVMRAASAPGERPHAGDCAACPGCGEFYLYEGGYRWRPLTLSEFAAQPHAVRQRLLAARYAFEHMRAAAAAL